MQPLDERELQARIAQVLDRWPAVGLAVGVVRDGSLAWFRGHGVADIASREPITEDTVFRVGSLTKTMTAVAVLQFAEQGLVDLDAPVAEYLRTFELAPANADLRPVTCRHLLTHTAGIGYWRRWSDLLRPGVGAGLRAHSVPRLADYYRGGLPVEVQPGTKWVYSNHGFAVLGQIVEDVTREPFDRYLRDHVFTPLGMTHTDLAGVARTRLQQATGYVLHASGPKPVADREVPLLAGGGAYSTVRDLVRYVAALLGGGTNEHGSVLKAETVAAMFAPQTASDSRVPGMGLSFELGEDDGRRTAGKGGIIAGFLSHMTLVPDDGLGVLALSNTGRWDPRGAPEPLAHALTRHLLGLRDDPIRHDIPARAEAWSELCGWYGMAPGPLTNVMDRLVYGAGVEVLVRRGHFMLRPLTPNPSTRGGYRLWPDDPDDPEVFRVDFSEIGAGTLRVAFSRPPGGGAMRLEGLGQALEKRPDALNPRRWLSGIAAGGAAGLAVRRLRTEGRGAGRRPRHRTITGCTAPRWP
jgi:CubicO group peptidase (beta-lactamase class C family)